MSDNSNNPTGVGFLGLLGLLFIGLKLSHVIDWSWWLVTLPLWGGTALVVAIIALAAAGTGVGAGVKAAARRRAISRARASRTVGSGRRVSIAERRRGSQ